MRSKEITVLIKPPIWKLRMTLRTAQYLTAITAVPLSPPKHALDPISVWRVGGEGGGGGSLRSLGLTRLVRSPTFAGINYVESSV